MPAANELDRAFGRVRGVDAQMYELDLVNDENQVHHPENEGGRIAVAGGFNSAVKRMCRRLSRKRG